MRRGGWSGSRMCSTGQITFVHPQAEVEKFYSLKGQYHEKVDEIRSLGINQC
jgi:hypothetical protein